MNLWGAPAASHLVLVRFVPLHGRICNSNTHVLVYCLCVMCALCPSTAVCSLWPIHNAPVRVALLVLTVLSALLALLSLAALRLLDPGALLPSPLTGEPPAASHPLVVLLHFCRSISSTLVVLLVVIPWVSPCRLSSICGTAALL